MSDKFMDNEKNKGLDYEKIDNLITDMMDFEDGKLSGPMAGTEEDIIEGEVIEEIFEESKESSGDEVSDGSDGSDGSGGEVADGSNGGVVDGSDDSGGAVVVGSGGEVVDGSGGEADEKLNGEVVDGLDDEVNKDETGHKTTAPVVTVDDVKEKKSPAGGTPNKANTIAILTVATVGDVKEKKSPAGGKPNKANTIAILTVAGLMVAAIIASMTSGAPNLNKVIKYVEEAQKQPKYIRTMLGETEANYTAQNSKGDSLTQLYNGSMMVTANRTKRSFILTDDRLQEAIDVVPTDLVVSIMKSAKDGVGTVDIYEGSEIDPNNKKLVTARVKLENIDDLCKAYEHSGTEYAKAQRESLTKIVESQGQPELRAELTFVTDFKDIYYADIMYEIGGMQYGVWCVNGYIPMSDWNLDEQWDNLDVTNVDEDLLYSMAETLAFEVDNLVADAVTDANDGVLPEEIDMSYKEFDEEESDPEMLGEEEEGDSEMPSEENGRAGYSTEPIDEGAENVDTSENENGGNEYPADDADADINAGVSARQSELPDTSGAESEPEMKVIDETESGN